MWIIIYYQKIFAGIPQSSSLIWAFFLEADVRLLCKKPLKSSNNIKQNFPFKFHLIEWRKKMPVTFNSITKKKIFRITERKILFEKGSFYAPSWERTFLIFISHVVLYVLVIVRIYYMVCITADIKKLCFWRDPQNYIYFLLFTFACAC